MKRQGFTLVEVLMALALTAVLMIGIYRLLPEVISRPMDPVSSRHETQLQSVMERDLRHAATLTVDGQELVITGFSHIDPATGQWGHRPAEARYGLQEVGEVMWLLRRQTSLDQAGDPVSVKILWPRVTRMVIGEPTEAATPTPHRLRFIPPLLHVQLEYAGGEEPLKLALVTGR